MVAFELVLADRGQGKGGGVEGLVVWEWRNVRPDLWPGRFVFGATARCNRLIGGFLASSEKAREGKMPG